MILARCYNTEQGGLFWVKVEWAVIQKTASTATVRATSFLHLQAYSMSPSTLADLSEHFSDWNLPPLLVAILDPSLNLISILT